MIGEINRGNSNESTTERLDAFILKKTAVLSTEFNESLRQGYPNTCNSEKSAIAVTKTSKDIVSKTVVRPTTSFVKNKLIQNSSPMSFKKANWKSSISPRQTMVTRTTALQAFMTASPTTVSGKTTSNVSTKVFSAVAMSPGTHVAKSTEATKAAKTERDKEKRDMQKLNEQFANYIEKMRFLESNNRKLSGILEQMRARKNELGSAIRQKYDPQLQAARELIDDNEKDKAIINVKIQALKDDISYMNIKIGEKDMLAKKNEEIITHQNKTIEDIEPEIILLKRRQASLEEEHKRIQPEHQRISNTLANIKKNLDDETVAHIDAENKIQTIEEEIKFLRELHEKEVRGLKEMIGKDKSNENMEYWKKELLQAKSEIQAEYDTKLDFMRNELETIYTRKFNEYKAGLCQANVDIQPIKDENKKLRDKIHRFKNGIGNNETRNEYLTKQLADLRKELSDKEKTWDEDRLDYLDELDNMRGDLEETTLEAEDLADKKMSLEMEIAAYRRLLEGEENRATGLGTTFHPVAVNKTTSSAVSYSANPIHPIGAKNEEIEKIPISKLMSAKTTYQRAAKGPITIAETHIEGKYIALENTGKKEEYIKGWKIKRRLDNKKEINFTLGSSVALQPAGAAGALIKIWARGLNPVPNGIDVEFNGDTWGVGTNVVTTLFNENSEEKATMIQKTSFA